MSRTDAAPLRLFTATLCCLLLAACGGDAPPAAPANPATSTNAAAPNPPANPTQLKPSEVVGVIADEVDVRAGGAAVADVRLSVTRGYHVNANPATEKFLIPTEIKIEPSEGITAGAPTYPAAATKKFSFSEKPLAVYEGEVSIKLPLRAQASAAKGQRKLRARLRYQACDEEKCYPPTSVDASIPITIS